MASQNTFRIILKVEQNSRKHNTLQLIDLIWICKKKAIKKNILIKRKKTVIRLLRRHNRNIFIFVQKKQQTNNRKTTNIREISLLRYIFVFSIQF